MKRKGTMTQNDQDRFKEAPDLARRNLVILCFLMSVFLIGGDLTALGQTVTFSMIFVGLKIKTSVFIGAVICMLVWFMYRYKISLQHHEIDPWADWKYEVHQYLNRNEALKKRAYTATESKIKDHYPQVFLNNDQYRLTYEIEVSNYSQIEVKCKTYRKNQTDAPLKDKNFPVIMGRIAMMRYLPPAQIGTILNEPTFTEWIAPYALVALQPLLVIQLLSTNLVQSGYTVGNYSPIIYVVIMAGVVGNFLLPRKT